MKVRLTEGQYERLKSLVKENEDNKYNREVTVNFNYTGLPYKGGEVDDILSVKTRVSFNIDIETKSWGISSLYIYNITGSPEIETEIYYYPEGQDDNTNEPITLALDWSKLEKEETKGGGFVSVGDYLDVDLVNNENGGFSVSKMTIEVYQV